MIESFHQRLMRIAERIAARRLAIYDLDDTLVSSSSSVTIEHGDGEVTVLDSASFAYFKGTGGDHIDFRDFNNVTKPRLIKKGMEALKKDVADADTRVVILTARPKGSASAVSKFMQKLGFKNVEAVALQSSDPMDKARWIEHNSGDAEEVEFTDDSSSNVKAVETLTGKIKAKVKVNHVAHPKEEDYEGETIQDIFESDNPAEARVEVKKDQEDQEDTSQPHLTSPWWKKQSPEFKQQYCKNHPDSQYCGAKAASMREAGLQEVVHKITKRIRDSEIAQRLIDKVMRYVQTQNPADDLTPAEVSAIYRGEEYGDEFDMPGKKDLDVEWSNHAEYRSDLRNVDPSKVNEAVRDFAELHPHQHKKVNLTNHGIGKAVVDVDTTSDDEEAAVITVMASGNDTKKLVLDRLAKIKSQKVKKYVHDGLIRKIDQAGDAAPIWLETLASHFNQLKAKDLMEGFEKSDFDDLYFVITGDKPSKTAADALLMPGAGDGNDDEDKTHHYTLGSVKTFWQIQDEGGKEHAHHWRLHCVKCNNSQTCKCSQPKVDAYGLCYDCSEKAGIDFKTGQPKEQKCEVVLPPNKFDVTGKASVFLAGSIDMGSAEDWQSTVINYLKDVECVVLNPRRKDWDCVDSETMALTPEGPKPYSELHVGDLIFTFSQDRDVLEVQTVEKMNVFEIDDELVEFTRNDCSFFFTENHELLDRISIRHNRTKKVKAGWFLGKNDAVRFPAGKSLEDVRGEEIIPYGRGFSDDHFRLAAWVLAEGSVYVRKDTGATQVSIAQYRKNGKKVEEIEALLNRLEMNHRYDNREFILDKDSSDFIVGIMGLEKYKIPAWVKDSPIRQRKIFVYEYAKGDGCMVGERISYICFGDRYRSFAKEMMVLCYGSGIGIKWRDKTSGFGHPVINLVPHNEDKKWFCLKSKGKVPYKGVVWCPTTKNGTWVAYRNGIPFITGNSSWKQEIGNAQFREQVEWELKGLEDASLISLCLTKDSKAPISLLELGLHVMSGRVVVCCPEGYWRKGNVDVVCSRYGVQVYEDFGEFCRAVKYRVEGLKEAKKVLTARDRQAWQKDATEFIIGMRRANMNSSRSRQAVSMDFNEMMRKKYAPNVPSFTATSVKEGDICSVNLYVARPMMNKKDMGTGNMFNILKRILLQGDGKVVVEEVGGDWAMVYAHDNPVSRMIGSVQVPVAALKIVGKSAFTADDETADPMAKEKLSSLFLALHTWATRKATSLPPGAPVVTQILDGLNAVEKALAGKMGLTGRDAVVELLKAMRKHFTMDAPPIPSLIRKYGVSAIRDAAGRFFASNDFCRFGEIPLGGYFKFMGHLWKREHGKFGQRVDLIGEGRGSIPFDVDDSVYPTDRDGKPRKAGMGDTYPVGALRGRPDYGEMDGDVENKIVNIENNMPIENQTVSSDSFRVNVIANRIVASAKEFMANDGENVIEGPQMRLMWRDGRDSAYRLDEMPVSGKKRLRVRSNNLSPYAKQKCSFMLMVNVIDWAGINKNMSYDEVAKRLDWATHKMLDEANKQIPAGEKPLTWDQMAGNPTETQVFYLEVEPFNTKPFVTSGKDFKLQVSWGQFKGYSPDSDFDQADPHYTMYQSKSPTAARKLYKILMSFPDALQSVTWSNLGDWLTKNGVAYETQFSVWH